MFEDILTKKVLKKDYEDEFMTVAGIARKYNTTATTVRLYMKKYGIAFRNLSRDLTGKRFGRLVAIKTSGKDKHSKSRWRCECDCGNYLDINASSLVRELSTSCGCYKSELVRKNGYKDMSFSWWRKMQKGAIQRGYEFCITMEYIWKIYEKQNRMCPLSNLPIVFFPDSNRRQYQTASLDRIDSNLGYIKGNIQVVNKVINQMKSYFSEEEFIAFCNLVAKRRPMSYEDSINKSSRSILRKV